MYSIYPAPGGRQRGRPGQVVAAAVLSYVEAGFLLLTGLILFSGSSAVSDWSNHNDRDHLGWGAQFAVAGLGDIVAAGLLIVGGVVFTAGKRLGRTLLAVGLAVCVVEAVLLDQLAERQRRRHLSVGVLLPGHADHRDVHVLHRLDQPDG